MKIAIREKLRPFSHRFGISCLIPGTTLKIQAFPTFVRIEQAAPERRISSVRGGVLQNLSSLAIGKLDLALNWTGPVCNFTLQQDLEKDCVFLFGQAQEGFFRFQFSYKEKGIEVVADRLPASGCTLNGKPFHKKGKQIFPFDTFFALPTIWERLSLGVAKAQDWDLVWRRFDLREILPVLFCLGQKTPYAQEARRVGAATLLNQKSLEPFCRAGFSQLLVPRLYDDEHQGLCIEEGEGDDASFLLYEAYQWIRSLFFIQDGNNLTLLPDNRWASGRLTQVQVEKIGSMDLEWGGFQLRRAILRASNTSLVQLILPKAVHSFRMKTSLSEWGKRVEANNQFEIEKGKTYYFDTFHKVR